MAIIKRFTTSISQKATEQLHKLTDKHHIKNPTKLINYLIQQEYERLVEGKDTPQVAQLKRIENNVAKLIKMGAVKQYYP